MNIKHYTPEAFITVATLEDGIYWLEADGDDVIVTVPQGTDQKQYGLRGPLGGSITVQGGDGDAIRDGDGIGSAHRVGSGDGDAIRRGDGDGHAIRCGGGNGFTIRSGNGDGDGGEANT